MPHLRLSLYSWLRSRRRRFRCPLDGDWCRADGKRLSVKGPDIVTPGGKPLRADYARAFASWVIPEGEPNAGITVTMMLVGSDRAHMREGAADTPPEEWRRCLASAG